MIVVFGSINVDLTCRVDAIARPGETVLAQGYEQSFGGKGANQAVAASRALGRDGEVRMVGAVGDDAFGRAAVANLQREGVDTTCVSRSEKPTGCAFISVERSGENAITVASGANQALRARSLPEHGGEILVMQMEAPFDECVAAVSAMRRRGARTIVNFAPAVVVEEERLARLLAVTDVLVVNEHEARAVARVLGREEGGLEAVAADLSTLEALAVIVTLGKAGAVLAEAGRELVRVPSLAVDVVDTTGAGDTLVGVLAAGLHGGLCLPAALARGVAAASLACRASGAQAAMPARAAIDAASG